MRKADRITAEVRALETLDLRGLRDEWRRRYGDPPKLRSTGLLARLLAWRIQADAFGGLDAATIRKLTTEQPPPPRHSHAPGTRICREWQGQRHEVEVLEKGFRYDGEEFQSLSEIARSITGTRWNGPKFFGLREAAG